MTDRSETVLRITRDYKLADEWALVLVSQGLSPSVRLTSEGVVLSVPEEELQRALAGLSAYENENPFPTRKEENRSENFSSLMSGFVVAGVLIVSHAFFIRWKETAPWFERGSADASQILGGELWRTVTALILHADLAHMFSNAIAAAIFASALSSIVGAGLALALLVLAGAGGNLTNAWMQGSSHVSIGASTAIFGAIGVLGGHGLIRRRREPAPGRGVWMPFAAALALLAMLGTGTGRTDVLAHLFGFFFGAVLGVPVALFVPDQPGERVQWICGSATVATVIYCWALALG
jgi:membrane associated rhomboid family serine protease